MCHHVFIYDRRDKNINKVLLREPLPLDVRSRSFIFKYSRQ